MKTFSRNLSPRNALENQRDSPKPNVFFALSVPKVCETFFVADKTYSGISYLGMPELFIPAELQDTDNETSVSVGRFSAALSLQGHIFPACDITQ